MQTLLTLPFERDRSLPDGYADEVRTPVPFVEHFLEEFSAPGDVVLDPFAGFGTTLRVAERLDRVAYGVEYESDRAALVADAVDHSDRVIDGDARALSEYDLPPVDCCLTSPPFMVDGMSSDPFENYDAASESNYERYLADLRAVFDELAAVLAPGGRVLLDVSNIKHEGEVTTLAWDVGRAGAERFRLDGEVVVGWENDGDGYGGEPEGTGGDHRSGTYGYGYDHSYCLIFTAEE